MYVKNDRIKLVGNISWYSAFEKYLTYSISENKRCLEHAPDDLKEYIMQYIKDGENLLASLQKYGKFTPKPNESQPVPEETFDWGLFPNEAKRLIWLLISDIDTSIHTNEEYKELVDKYQKLIDEFLENQEDD